MCSSEGTMVGGQMPGGVTYCYWTGELGICSGPVESVGRSRRVGFL